MNKLSNLTRQMFWIVVSTILYTFVGYPILVSLLSKWRQKPVEKSRIFPSISLVIPAFNEEDVIAEKIDNSLSLNYPSYLLDVVVVADGSVDRTVSIAEQFDEVRIFHEAGRKGKAAAINRVTPKLNTEVIVFTDANSMLNSDALIELAANFADPGVGGVAGTKKVLGGGEGLYWRYESFLKRCDSDLGSVMGASGELFAIRQELFQPVEEDSIIEDFILSMRIVNDGWRVVFETRAIASEPPSSSLKQDWQRRTRIAAGGLQSILRLPGLLDPRKGIISWQYISHRVSRWLVTPIFLPLAFLLNATLLRYRPYRYLFMAQLTFYGAGLLGYFWAKSGFDKGGGLLNAVFYFVFSNLAALAGLWRYARGKQSVTWRKAR